MISIITLTLPIEQAVSIKEFSRKENIPVSVILREGAILFMDKKKGGKND